MMIIFWLSICVLSVVIELFAHNLVAIWIALGAIIASISTFFTANEYIQILVFSSVSLIMLVVTKGLIEKYINKVSCRNELEKTKEFELNKE